MIGRKEEKQKKKMNNDIFFYLNKIEEKKFDFQKQIQGKNCTISFIHISQISEYQKMHEKSPRKFWKGI